MRIGVISDLHCTEANKEACLTSLEEAVSALSEVDYVVLLGDVITNVDPATDLDLISAVADHSRSGDVPVRAVPGNHDVMNQSPDKFASLFNHAPYGHETVAGQTLIFLDSSAPWIPGSRGELSAGQLTFLEETLPEVDDALVFAHHPLHYHDISDNQWFGEHPERAFCSNKKEVNEIFDRYGGVRAVFNGHIHEGDHTVYNGVNHVTVPDFTRGCPAEESEVSGRHVIVEVEGESLTVTVQTPDEEIAEYTL